MNVYYNNILKNSLDLTANTLEGGYAASDLYYPFLSRNALFQGNGGTITASWSMGKYADSIALCACNFDNAAITVSDVNNTTVYSSNAFNSGQSVTIIKLPDIYHIKSLSISLSAAEQLKIGYLYVGKRVALPQFDIKPKNTLAINSNSERGLYGQVYGIKRPSHNALSLSFSRINNHQKFIMTEYMNYVQKVEPHIVEPYEDYSIPPMYCVLSNGGEFEKRIEDGFYFGTSMAWEEAR